MAGLKPKSEKVMAFELDARRRAAAGRPIDFEGLLAAKDDACELKDHVGLTVLRGRVKDQLEVARVPKYRAFLNQLLAVLAAAEMHAAEVNASYAFAA